MKKQSSNGELGNFFQQILIVFVILKLVPGTDVNNWSWWWVLSPLWIPILIIVLVALYVFIMNVGKSQEETTYYRKK